MRSTKGIRVPKIVFSPAEDSVELKEAPSRFLPYPTNKFIIRRLTLGEVKRFAKLNTQPSVELNISLYSSALKQEDIRLEDTIVVDTKWLILAITALTMQEFQLNVSYFCPNENCPHNSTPIEDTLALEDIEFEELKAKSFTYQGKDFFPYRTKDEIFLEKAQEDINDILEDRGLLPDDREMITLTLCANPEIANSHFGSLEMSIEMFERTLEEIMQLPYFPKEVAKLYADLTPDIGLIDRVCPSCGAQFKFRFELPLNKALL